MAVGDMVNGIFVAAGTYQPAAGVEVIITFLSPLAAGDNWYLWNGASLGFIDEGTHTFPPATRLFITNTNYLRFARSGANYAGYSGYQIK